MNLGVALVLLRAARAHRSATLQANAHHLLTDVWTSAGVLVGVGAVAATGWQRLDPIVAMLVAANIVWTGSRIVISSVAGLMDVSLPATELCLVSGYILDRYGLKRESKYHALRTRQAGSPAVRVRARARSAVNGPCSAATTNSNASRLTSGARFQPVTVFTHLKPVGDPLAMDDQDLHRDEAP